MIFAIAGVTLTVGGAVLLLAASQLEHTSWKVLVRPLRIERFVYRNHRLFGCAIVTGALVVMTLLSDYGRIIITNGWQYSLVAQLTLKAIWVLTLFALIVGIYVGIRPSALKGLEALSNRWIEPNRTLGISGEAPRGRIRVTEQLLGTLLLLAGIACLLVAA